MAVVWVGLVVRRLLRGVLGAGFWRAGLLGGVFVALYGTPLYLLPGSYFWYRAAEEAAAAPPVQLNVEETFYAQPRLLAARTAPLLAQRAGTTDLYFLGFAPYGDQDVFHQIGGFYPGDTFGNALFENPGNDNAHLTLELRGANANHFGVGARIAVTVREDGATRTIHALAGSGGSFGGSSLRQEIGLGRAAEIVAVTVDWLASR